MMNHPKISICVITYNHVNYISKCLQSLVEQKTTYDFEIIVSDDNSTDGADQIIKSFAKKYPHIIFPIFNSINLGPERNYYNAHCLARGEYIAYLDGDDYALPGKLEIQANFLDMNQDCSMVFHECATLDINNHLTHNLIANKKYKTCNFLEFLYLYPSKMWHSSKMYRRSAIITSAVSSRRFCDKHLHFEHGLSGKTGFINQTLGVYRSNVGISSNINYVQEMVLDSYEYAREIGYDPRMLAKIISREYFEHGIRCLEAGDFKYFKKWVVLGFKFGHITINSLLAFSFKNHPQQYIKIRNFLRECREQISNKKYISPPINFIRILCSRMF